MFELTLSLYCDVLRSLYRRFKNDLVFVDTIDKKAVNNVVKNVTMIYIQSKVELNMEIEKMKSKLLTVAEYAELKGISKQAVYQRLKNEEWKQEHSKLVDGKLFIDMETFDQEVDQSDSSENNVRELLVEIELLKDRLNDRDRQIEKLERHIDDLTNGWRESQRTVSVLTHRVYQLEHNEPVQVDEIRQQEQEKQGFFQRIRIFRK